MRLSKIISDTEIQKFKAELKVIISIFEGKQKWTFRFLGERIHASIEDSEWLDSYQSGIINLSPKSSLYVELESRIKYDFNDKPIEKNFIIKKVMKVISPEPQIDLF